MNMEPYKKFLAEDKKAALLFKNDIVVPEKTKNITESLVGSILSQQLSTQVAKVMFTLVTPGYTITDLQRKRWPRWLALNLLKLLP